MIRLVCEEQEFRIQNSLAAEAFLTAVALAKAVAKEAEFRIKNKKVRR